MSVLQAMVLVLIAIAAPGMVSLRNPLDQAVMYSFFGQLLAIFFMLVQAPDVALSQAAIGAVVLPLLILVALSKVREPSS